MTFSFYGGNTCSAAKFAAVSGQTLPTLPFARLALLIVKNLQSLELDGDCALPSHAALLEPRMHVGMRRFHPQHGCYGNHHVYRKQCAGVSDFWRRRSHGCRSGGVHFGA